MPDNIIVVPKLCVQVVTGDTCYRHEDGFSAIYAEVAAEDASLAECLTQAQQERRVVTLRCAMLDVVGRISTCKVISGTKTFVLPVEDMVHRKPHHP